MEASFLLLIRRIIGLFVALGNFYHDNQWEHPGGEKIHWHIHPRDPRWVPFSSLLADAYARYRLPIFIAETSHVGVGRAEWIRELSQEICLALERGVSLEGVCPYPILDRFEWNDRRTGTTAVSGITTSHPTAPSGAC